MIELHVRLVRFVDGGAATRSQLQAGKLGESDIGPDTYGSDDEISGKDPLVGKGHRTFVYG